MLFSLKIVTRAIREGEQIGMLGANTRGEARYTGPCPPKEYEPNEHRYFFKLYALDAPLELTEGATREEVEKAMEGKIIEKTELMGVYAQ